MSYPQFDSKYQTQKLTIDDETKNENMKGMYVLIRLIDTIERQYNFDRIAEADYTKLLKKYLDRVETFQRQIPNFNCEKFCEDYGLQECTWAKERIKTGIDDKNKMSETSYYLQLNSKFLEVIETLQFVKKDKLIVGEIRLLLDDLCFMLQKKVSALGPDFATYFNNLKEYKVQTIDNKDLGEMLSQEEGTKLQYLLESAFQKFRLII